MPAPPIQPATGISLGRFAFQGGKYLFRHDENENFLRALQRRLEHRRGVDWAAVSGFRVDPDFQHCVAQVLAGNASGRDDLRVFLGDRLVDPVEKDLSKANVIEIIVAAAEEAGHEAMRSPARSEHRDANLTRSEVRLESHATREHVTLERQIVTDKLADLQHEVIADVTDAMRQQFGGPSVAIEKLEVNITVNVLATAIDFGEPEPDVAALTELVLTDRPGVAVIRRLLDSGGVEAVVDAIERRAEQLADPAGGRLEAAARIVSAAGFFRAATTALSQASRAAEATSDQAIRRRLNGAGAALVIGDEDRANTLIDEARQLGPDHPAVAIAEARRLDEPQLVLSALDDVVGTTDSDVALLAITRAQAHLALDEVPEAERYVAIARERSPEHPMVREFEAMLPLEAARSRLVAGQPPDKHQLPAAANMLVALRDDLRAQRRHVESAVASAYAVEALAILGDAMRAAALLEETTDEERHASSALLLGRSALMARRPDLALVVVPEDLASPEAQLMRADAMTMLGPREREVGLQRLRELMPQLDDDRLRIIAAFALLAGTASDGTRGWDEAAAAVLTVSYPERVAVFKAEREIGEGSFDDAETTLIPFADDAGALRLLVRIAVEKKDWDQARLRADELYRRTSDPGDKLTYADTLRFIGDFDHAVVEFLEVARSQEASLDVRAAAYQRATAIANTRLDFVEMERVTAEWIDVSPVDGDAAWSRVLALARLARHDEALTVYDAKRPPVIDLPRALLAAEVLTRAAEPERAVREIAELSEQFGRDDERLELATLRASWGAHDLPPELADRVRDGYAMFNARFPESHSIVAIPAPATADEFQRLVREQLGGQARAEAIRDLEARIRDGSVAAFNLVLVAPVGVATVWGGLRNLPIGFADPALDEVELGDAREAIGGGAVWDSSALAIIDRIGDRFATTTRNALLGSMVALATVTDIDQDAAAAAGPQPVARTGVSETGDVFYQPVTDDELATERARIARVLGLARSLATQPDRDPTSTNAEDTIQARSDFPHKLLGFPATVSVARRFGRPIYSDDRVLRVFARSCGLKSFGTLALIDALAERRLITPAERRDYRTRLLAGRAWGVRVSADELLACGRASGWILTPELAGAFRDRAFWRAQPGEIARRLATFLNTAFREAPEHLEVWFARTIDAAVEALPEARLETLLTTLMMVALNPLADKPESDGPRVSTDCFKALIAAIDNLPFHLRPRGGFDPVKGAVIATLEGAIGESPVVRAGLFQLIARRLPPDYVYWAIQTFVK